MPQKLANSFSHAAEGVIFALFTQRNMRIHLWIAGGVLAAALILRLDRLEFLLVFVVIFFVLIMELVNTIVEELADLLMPGHSHKVKAIKDMAAGTVLLVSLCAIIFACFIFTPHLILLFSKG